MLKDGCASPTATYVVTPTDEISQRGLFMECNVAICMDTYIHTYIHSINDLFCTVGSTYIIYSKEHSEFVLELSNFYGFVELLVTLISTKRMKIYRIGNRGLKTRLWNMQLAMVLCC